MKKIPLAFLRLSVRTGWRWLLANSLPFLAHALLVTTGLFFWFLLCGLSCNSLARNQVEFQQPALLSGTTWQGCLRLFPPLVSVWCQSTHVLATRAMPPFSILGIAVAALTYPVVGIQGTYLALVIVLVTFFFFIPYLSWFEGSPFTQSSVGEGICDNSLSSFSSPGCVVEPAWFLQWWPRKIFISLFWRAYRKWSKRVFLSALITVITATSLKMAQELVATTLSWQLSVAGNSSFVSWFSVAVLGDLCGLSQRVGRHHFSLKPYLMVDAIRFVLTFAREGIYMRNHQRKALTTLSPLSALVLIRPSFLMAQYVSNSVTAP